MSLHELEQEIRTVIATEPNAMRLSERIFAHDGLFAKLATTQEERKLLIASPLYRQAQDRFHELQSKELATFRAKIADLRKEPAYAESTVKVERSRASF